ncbi:ATP-binding protein [Uliginosibacterium sp. H1]|uniref:ATP-binding protein n=1 Tax=Uliginosibacterium sp. H1 TaxID=3114757 RepID=UPI002E177706|nr:ATP-binding protein [Uliginosibacterium sp. H1]
MDGARVKRPLGYRLFLLAATGIFPLAILAALAMVNLAADRRSEAERAALELSRALASAVDAELRSTQAALETLSLSEKLDNDSVTEFFRTALRSTNARAGWRSLALTDAAGTTLFQTDLGPESRGAPMADPSSLRQVLATAAPVVGHIVRTAPKVSSVPVRMPVIRDGKLRYTLTAFLDPDVIRHILSAQRVPESWVVSVLDDEKNIVARSRSNERYIGTRPHTELYQLLERYPEEGVDVTLTLEGQSVIIGMTRLAGTGWRVAVGIPSNEVQRSTWRSLTAFGFGIATSFLLCAGLMLLAARRISRPIEQLRESAMALGRDERVMPLSSGIRELDDLGLALSVASRERRRANHEREELRAAEHEALTQAQQASRAKDEFLAMLGHELRNPLAPIITTLEVLRLRGERSLEPQLQVIRRQVSHMTRLVEDLLDVSRITAGRLELNAEPVDIDKVVERALEAVSPLADKRSRKIGVRLAGEPTWVIGDGERLVQVVTNLLTNALKFTPPDQPLDVSVERREDSVRILVEDGGSGIASDLLPRVFELFSQGDQQLARRSGGLGLGLAIVKNLVEMHRGTVSASSAGPGMGSTFTVTLPLVSDIAQQIAEEERAQADGPVGNILVVDDNVDAADTLATALGMNGHAVRTAYDAGSAISLLDEFQPDLAILDIGLPDMDGYQLAGAIKAHPRARGCVLVALTGYGQRTDQERAFAAGFARHLTKPVEWDTLMEIVTQALAKDA